LCGVLLGGPNEKLDEFAKAHFLLIGVNQALSVILLGNWRGSAVPTPQYDLFAHLDKPFARGERLANLRDFWTRHCAERDEWLMRAYEEVVPSTDRS